jgi:hypothetical protein
MNKNHFSFQFDFIGKISLYEYLLAQAALDNDNPETIFKCLFHLCDTDHDGLLTKPEFTNLFVGLLDSDNKTDTKNNMDDINKLVTKVFGDKEKLSASEFRQVCESDEEAYGTVLGLQGAMVVSLRIAPQMTKYGTE